MIAADNATGVIDRLAQLHPKGFDLSLDRIRELLGRLGNPQDRLPPAIHIAGTNGKGSAASFCRAMLEAAGLAAHVHTSPHLVRWHERYRLARPGGRGRLVGDATLAEALRRVAAANGGRPITVFELLTAAAFVLFGDHPADAAVIEVGLGGRLDATNVIARPAVSLVMPVALDHQAWLGRRIEQIAAEKAGIIKPGAPAVIGRQETDAARATLVAAAERRGCPFSVFGRDYDAREERGRLVYRDESGLRDFPLPQLVGRHQVANAAAAIRALQAAGFRIPDQAVEAGLREARWPGRLQRLCAGPLARRGPEGAEIWVDGGHNPAAGRAVAEALADLEDGRPRPFFLIAGMIGGKDPEGYFAAFAGMASHVLTVPVRGSDASLDPVALARAARGAGLAATPEPGVGAALARIAKELCGSGAPPGILIGGSLYLAGSVLAENGFAPD